MELEHQFERFKYAPLMARMTVFRNAGYKILCATTDQEDSRKGKLWNYDWLLWAKPGLHTITDVLNDIDGFFKPTERCFCLRFDKWFEEVYAQKRATDRFFNLEGKEIRLRPVSPPPYEPPEIPEDPCKDCLHEVYEAKVYEEEDIKSDDSWEKPDA